MLDADIIVIGAGPVGMLAALLSAQQGLKVLLLEQSVKRAVQSRAIGITPPTLEILRRLGLSEAFIERGISVQVSKAYDRKKFLGVIDFTELENKFKFVLSIPQDTTESLLEEAIVAHSSIRFLRGHHVTDCHEDGRITVSGRRADAGSFIFTGQYVFACDGGKSTLREVVGIPFDGAVEPYTFLMGDFEDTTGWGTQARFFLTERGSVESFPLPDGKRRYVVRTPFFIKENTTGYLGTELLWRAGIKVAGVRQFWESGFRVQRYIARTFCKGRVFLCGDSAHLMSPIGGQNMNTGFADAELAAWLSRPLIEQRAPHHLVCRFYNRVRKRAAGVSVRRAHVMMLAGASGGRVWSAIRSVAVLLILHTPIRRFLARVFCMQSIPGGTLENYQQNYERIELQESRLMSKWGWCMLDYFLPDMRFRNTIDKEKMELPDADVHQLRRTVTQFKRINALLSASHRLLREHFFSIMEQNPRQMYTLLDVGAGGCDIAIWAAREARRRGLRLNITALDNDARILPLAYHAIRGYPEISIVEGDALNLKGLGSFDFVFSNHLMHHFNWDEIKALLKGIIAQTRLGFVMNDLKRSKWAYLGFTIFSRLFTTGSFHFYDGRLSIKRAFLPQELRDFITQNFPNNVIKIVETSPARVVLIYET